MDEGQLAARLVDVALATIAVEALWLVRSRLKGARSPSFSLVIPHLAAGAALLLAVRVVLAEAPVFWVLPCLGASLVAHLYDLRQRWRRIDLRASLPS